MKAVTALLLGGNSQPAPAPWRTGDALLRVRGDFGSVRDSRGWSQFSPFWATLLADGSPIAHEWAANWKARGYTHIVLARSYSYPGSPIPGGNFSVAAFVLIVRAALNHGFSPILMLSDVPSEPILETVQALKDDGLLPYVICVPSWEPIPSSAWRSKQLSDVLIGMKRVGGDEIVIDVHLQPGRWSMASFAGVIEDGQTPPPGTKVKERFWDTQVEPPRWRLYLVEDDDPWNGDEQDCWKSHGGEHVAQFLYQFEHGGYTGVIPEGWEDRWRDGVPRMGNSLNGWRRMPICCFETVLYDDYKGAWGTGPEGEKQARRVAARARDIAAEYGVTVTYGNGAPDHE